MFGWYQLAWTGILGVYMANFGVKSSKNKNLWFACNFKALMVDECLMYERYAHMQRFPLFNAYACQ